MGEPEQSERDELAMRLDQAGWYPSITTRLGNGVRLTLRRWPWTSNFRGVPTFESFGKDDVEARQNTLLQLEEWGAADLDRRLKETGWRVLRSVPAGGGVQVTFDPDPGGYGAKPVANTIVGGQHLYDAIRVFLEQIGGAANDGAASTASREGTE